MVTEKPEIIEDGLATWLGPGYNDLSPGQLEEESIAMKTIPLSEAKRKPSTVIETLYVTDEEVTITRNGKPVAVLVSSAKWEDWQETVAVRNDAELLAEIKQGLAALKKKRAKLYTLNELFD